VKVFDTQACCTGGQSCHWDKKGLDFPRGSTESKWVLAFSENSGLEPMAMVGTGMGVLSSSGNRNFFLLCCFLLPLLGSAPGQTSSSGSENPGRSLNLTFRSAYFGESGVGAHSEEVWLSLP
jgi:hypothetical protein